MKRTGAASALTTSFVLLAGCAGLSDSECRGANWYDIGWRDARFKLQSQGSLYLRQCERYGVKVDAARYEQGHREGRWEFPDRTPL
jgi:hypothetical protein